MAQRVGRTRFSLLLLDEGEDVLADYLAFCDPPANRLPSAGGASLRGRLRLCSLSLVFDADERGVPVVRLPLVQAEALEAVGPASSPASALRLLARAWVLQTPGAPYAHERCGRGGAEEWRFTLAYAPLAQLLGPATLQAAVSKLPHWDRLAQLRECAAAREAAAPFGV